VHSKADKKTMNAQMLKQFANHDNVGDFLNGPYSKMEEKTIDKWVEMIKTMQDFPNLSYKALSRP
jgi:hypothetical protein